MNSSTTADDPGYAAQDKSHVVVLVVSLVLAISAMVVGLRIYTRARLLKHLGWDDYAVLFTLTTIVVDGALVLSTVQFGLGRHIDTLSTATVTDFLRNFWASIVVYNISLAGIKLTFLLQYNRVLAAHKMQKVMWILGALIMTWAIAQIFLAIFPCMPAQKFWDTDIPGKCRPDQPFWYINAAGNIVTDLVILALPLPVLSALQLRKKQKYFLLGIFSLGFFTCAISLIRLNYLGLGSDVTFDNVASANWSVAELGCGLTCACLPTLRPLISKLKPRWMSSYATRQPQAISATGGAGAQHGGGIQRNRGDAKSTTAVHTQGTASDSSMKLSSHRNYSRLFDGDDVERAMPMPMPSKPVLGSSRSQSPQSSESERDAIPMQQLHPKPSMKDTMPIQDGNSKAMSILGMGIPRVGVLTRVYGGRSSSSALSSTNEGYLGGIAVKHDVVVTTEDTQPLKDSHSSWPTVPR